MPRKLFVKGQSGNPGGVPKNPQNPKRKARIKVKEILDGLAFEPFKEMVILFKKTNKERVKAEILMDLCSYIAPKLKSVEFTSDNENPFIINLNLKPGKKRIDLSQLGDEAINDDEEK